MSSLLSGTLNTTSLVLSVVTEVMKCAVTSWVTAGELLTSLGTFGTVDDVTAVVNMAMVDDVMSTEVNFAAVMTSDFMPIQYVYCVSKTVALQVDSHNIIVYVA